MNLNAPKKKRGGAQPNSGRPKGKLAPQTLEKRAVLHELRQRTLRASDKLWNAQFAKAVGSVMVYRVDETKDKNGKITKEYVLIENPDEIKQVLDDNDGTSGSVGENYYLVTTVPPDNKAIDSMLDRTFGKAQQTIEIIEDPKNLSDEDIARELYRRLCLREVKPMAVAKFEQLAAEKFPNVDLKLLTDGK